jgi:hypothetical protein
MMAAVGFMLALAVLGARPKEAPATSGGAIAGLLSRAHQRFEALEYDESASLASSVLSREDVTPEQRADALLLLGSSLAIIGQPIEAEKAFRSLLDLRPEQDLPKDSPFKILTVFRKVQADQRAKLEAAKKAELERRIGGLKLEGAPSPARGGEPIDFAYRLVDPTSLAGGVTVMYRRKGNDPYAAAPLQLRPDGTWHVELAADPTTRDRDVRLDYFVSVFDRDGHPVRDFSSSDRPSSLFVDAELGPFYERAWFWIVVGGLAAAGGAAFFLTRHNTSPPSTDLGDVPFPGAK